jgi:predicted nuclease of restriction endonuclease-like (RecB) superfamily
MSDQPISLVPAPEGYADWLLDLKSRIHTAQQRAALAVNRELVLLYWQIGRDILARQASQGWGAKVIERLAHDLRTAFPEMKGFSPRNLKYMRAFAEAWPDDEFVQAVLAQLPWYHQLALLDKLSTPRNPPLVCGPGHPAQLVAQCVGDADRNPLAGAQRLRCYQL